MQEEEVEVNLANSNSQKPRTEYQNFQSPKNKYPAVSQHLKPKYRDSTPAQGIHMVKDFSKSKQSPTGSFGRSKVPQKQKKGPKPVCYSFRDKGTCSYGDQCKFSHEKSTTAYVVATQEQLDEQYGANAVYQYKKKKFSGKMGNAKKMSNHRNKIRFSNSRRQSAHLTEVTDEFSESESQEEDTEVANSAEVDQPSEDTFDLSPSDSESQEDL